MRSSRLLPSIILIALVAAAALGIVHTAGRTMILGMSAGAAIGLLRALSVVQLAMGLAIFRWAGGRFITPVGIYFLSSAVFLGYGGLAPASSRASLQYLAYASVTLLAFNLIVLVVIVRSLGASRIRWRTSPDEGDARQVLRSSGGPLRVVPIVVIWAAFTAGSSLIRSIPILGNYANIMQVGISLLLLQALLGHGRSHQPLRIVFGVPVFAALAVGSFYVNYYTGFGRIIMGGFIIGAATLVNRRHPELPLKTLLLISLVPSLIFAGANDRTGLTFREAASGIAEARGVSSATGAVPVFAMTLEQHDTVGLDAYPFRNGRSLLTSAVHWVPREWWPTKPNSVEIELAQLLYPEVQFGYSIVGSNALEWLLNFDLIGLVPGALLTGILLAATERWTREPLRRRRPLPHDLVLRALVTGNLTIYVWAGSFSFAARTFTPFMVILGLRSLAQIGTRRTATRTPSAGQ